MENAVFLSQFYSISVGVSERFALGLSELSDKICRVYWLRVWAEFLVEKRTN